MLLMLGKIFNNKVFLGFWWLKFLFSDLINLFWWVNKDFFKCFNCVICLFVEGIGFVK